VQQHYSTRQGHQINQKKCLITRVFEIFLQRSIPSGLLACDRWLGLNLCKHDHNVMGSPEFFPQPRPGVKERSLSCWGVVMYVSCILQPRGWILCSYSHGCLSWIASKLHSGTDSMVAPKISMLYDKGRKLLLSK
jgi:hypothetical protein